MQEVKFFVAGDVVNDQCLTGEVCAPALAQIVASADYSVCNFEAPISRAGKPQPKSGSHLCQRPETLTGLRRQGFDLVLLANNHIMDFGHQGLAATMQTAAEAGLDTVGAGLDFDAAYRPLVKHFGDMKIGIVNACEAQFGVLDYFDRSTKAGYAWINHHRIDQTILDLRGDCDFVLVFVHAGLENYSIPQKEWRKRYKHLCDLGADVVIGTHPHLPQGYETHGNSLIFYSLGNFYFDSQNYANSEDRTYSVLLTLSKKNGFNFEAVYHYKQDGAVHLAEKDKQIDLEWLCHLLGETYQEAHDAMSLKAYERIVKKLRFSVNPSFLGRGIMPTLKAGAKRLLGRNPKIDKDLIQLHLLRNEAYYFAVRHALEIKARDKYG